MPTLKIWIILLCFFLHFSLFVLAQDTIRYRVIFPNAMHHECEISILLTDLIDKPLYLVMSNSSPGRYANHLFSKNVDGLSAYSIDDEPLSIKRQEPNLWMVEPENGYVKINYTLFANHPDGTYSGIDRQFAHFNIPSAFIWFKGLEDKPIRIDFEFHPDQQWKVATQLKKLKENSYFAPGLEYFMDSPTILADFDIRQFIVKNGRKDERINVVFNPDSEDTIEDQFTEMVEKIVLEQRAIFGELPDYDFDEYTFIGCFSEAYHGDGMEHRNSTIITQPDSLQNNQLDFIGTFSHEFFHCWNVERIRPKSIEPFDFTKANVCPELWFAEGFTSYYGPLTLFRSGIYDTTAFLNELAGMLNYVLNSPGTGKNSLVTMSEMAPFVDASKFIDATNFKNTFTSYYPYGAMIGLALDLALRSQFSNMSLDDLMRYMWDHYGKSELPYTNDNIIAAIAALTRNEQFANSFFDKYIFGLEVPEYDILLHQAGFDLVTGDSSKTDLRASDFKFENGKMFYNTLPYERSTFYVAGLDKGDEVFGINGRLFLTNEELEEYFNNLKIGASLKIQFQHYGESLESVTLVKPYRHYAIIDIQEKGMSLTENQRKIREDWLKSRMGS